MKVGFKKPRVSGLLDGGNHNPMVISFDALTSVQTTDRWSDMPPVAKSAPA